MKWLAAHKTAVSVVVALAAILFVWWRLRRVSRVSIIDIPVIGSVLSGKTEAELDADIQWALDHDGKLPGEG